MPVEVRTKPFLYKENSIVRKKIAEGGDKYTVKLARGKSAKAAKEADKQIALIESEYRELYRKVMSK